VDDRSELTNLRYEICKKIDVKMFTNFDGAHRRTPNVSIRGASKKESKEELLERAHRERTRREV